MAIRFQEAASVHLDEIYRFTRDRWGDAQADTHVNGLFAAFEQIGTRGVASRPVPAEFGLEGYIFRDERHFVYWKRLANGDTGIVTILRDRVHQIERFKGDFE